jgi:hypothetical protein
LRAQRKTRGRAHPTPDERLVFDLVPASEGDPEPTLTLCGRWATEVNLGDRACQNRPYIPA